MLNTIFKKKVFLTTILSSTLLTTSSTFAQIPTSSTTPSGLSGAINSAPAKINLKFLEIALKHVLNSVHSLSIDERIKTMDPNTTINRVAALNIEGAIIHDYDESGFGAITKKDTLVTGRNIGFQYMPYSITALSDGSHLIKISVASFKNMNALMNYSKDDDSIFNYLDRLDLLTIKLDKNSSFKDLSTITVDILDANIKLGIVQSKSNYLALTAGGNAGFIFSNHSLPGIDKSIYESGANKQFPQRLGDNGEMYGDYQNDGLGFSTSGNVGLELNLEKKRTRVNFKGSYSTGFNNYTVSEIKTHENNVLLRKSHLKDDLFKVDGYKDPNLKARRNSQYIHYSIDASRMVSRAGKTPIRMGLIIKANVILNDKITYPNESIVNFNDFQKEKVSTGLYINF